MGNIIAKLVNLIILLFKSGGRQTKPKIRESDSDTKWTDTLEHTELRGRIHRIKKK